MFKINIHRVNIINLIIKIKVGRGGIRTPGIKDSPVFKTGTIDQLCHSSQIFNTVWYTEGIIIYIIPSKLNVYAKTSITNQMVITALHLDNYHLPINLQLYLEKYQKKINPGLIKTYLLNSYRDQTLKNQTALAD